MRKTAESGRGTFTYIGNVKEVKEKLDGLFRKLESPVLTDITIDQAGWSGLEQYPAKIADLYEGEPMVLATQSRFPPATGNVARPGRNPTLVAVCLIEELRSRTED